jgi:hypothetical protein
MPGGKSALRAMRYPSTRSSAEEIFSAVDE